MLNKDKLKVIIISLSTTISILLISFFSYFNKPIFVPFNDFNKMISKNEIKTVSIISSDLLNFKDINGINYSTQNPDTKDFKETLLNNNIYVNPSNTLNTGLKVSYLFLIGSIFSLVYFFFFPNLKKIKEKSKADYFEYSTVDNNNFDFDKVAGNKEAKESLYDIVDYLKNPEKFKKYNAKISKGILLYGEPGTGKTLLAKALAGESKVPFYALSGSDFVQIYVGVGASRIRKLFASARKHKNAIIFIDEIDAIGQSRNSTNSGEKDQTLNALLTEMSGFNSDDGIIVIAATNRIDTLDSALLRPGRFDRHIDVKLPDTLAREKILNLYLKTKPTGYINIKDIALKTTFFSGAKLEHLVNEAAILACKDFSTTIESIHLNTAFSNIVAGQETNTSLKPIDKKIIAYHESGHALASLLLLKEEKLSKVSIIPTTKGSGGYTMCLPSENMFYTKDYLERKIQVLLAGRIAEDIIFGSKNITNGAQSDISQCTSIVKSMVLEYGMSESIGLLNYSILTNNLVPSPSEISIIKNIISDLYDSTKSLLLEHKKELESIALILLEKESIDYNDIPKIAV